MPRDLGEGINVTNGWEFSSYAEHYKNACEKFEKETLQYLEFMKKRHEVVTIDYIATLEYKIKMLESELKHLKDPNNITKGFVKLQ